MPLITPPVKNIKEVTEPLKEEILNGNVHTIDEMKAWFIPYGFNNVINKAFGVSHPIPRGVNSMV